MSDFSGNDDEGFGFSDDFSESDYDSDDSQQQVKRDGDNKNAAAKNAPKKVSKHILQLKEKLGLDKVTKKQPANSTGPSTSSPKVETLATKLRPDIQPEVVVYKAPSKKKPKLVDVARPETSPSEPEEMNIHKIKHEVRRLGIQALDQTSREEAKVALAISLGAIPTKKKGVNYKTLKEQKRKEQEEAARRAEVDEMFAARLKTMNKKPALKKDKNKVASFDAQFGKFDGGVQRLSKFQMKKLSSKKK